MVGLDNLRLVSIYKEKNLNCFKIFTISTSQDLDVMWDNTSNSHHNDNYQRRRRVQPPNFAYQSFTFQNTIRGEGICKNKVLDKISFSCA
jgi:hypothetical protein